jgi:hypothetical protein
MHCQKWGQDIVTSTKNQYQLWFGARLFLRNFSVILTTTFFFIIATGQTFFKTPTFGNAKRCVQFFDNLLIKITYEINRFTSSDFRTIM